MLVATQERYLVAALLGTEILRRMAREVPPSRWSLGTEILRRMAREVPPSRWSLGTEILCRMAREVPRSRWSLGTEILRRMQERSLPPDGRSGQKSFAGCKRGPSLPMVARDRNPSPDFWLTIS